MALCMRSIADALLVRLARHAGLAIAAGVFLGLLAPPLAALCRPLLVPAILVPFVIALLRLDWQRLVFDLRRPWLPLLALAWVLLLSPLLVAGLVAQLGIATDLAAILIVTAACPPLMASGALALLMGLDVGLAVLTTVTASALVPLTLPSLALPLAGLDLALDATSLLLRLAALVGVCFALATLLRRGLGAARIVRHGDALGGLAVLGLILFAVAVMDGVTARLLQAPAVVARLIIAAFALNLGLQVLTALVMAPFGRRRALTLGLLAGNNNLGLVLAATVDAAPGDFVLFVGVAQFPIYLLPVLQQPLYQRWLAAHDRPSDA